MPHSITDTYKMKREILNFARNFSGSLSAPDAKFFADMTYGILASQSCLLTKIAHALQEKTKKAYTVDRLSDHLKDGVNAKAMAAYLNYVRKMVPSEPVVHIDDSDIIKPDGYHFEVLKRSRGIFPSGRFYLVVVHHPTWWIPPLRLRYGRNDKRYNVPRYVIPSERSESRNPLKWQILSCGGSLSYVVDSSTPVGMTMRLRFYEFAYCF